MITNINTLQHPTEDLQTVTDVYLKQSLANLGQRFSIKGDGLQTGELNLYEMFLRDYDKGIDEKAYCKIVVETPVNLTSEQKDLLKKLEASLNGEATKDSSDSSKKDAASKKVSHKPKSEGFLNKVKKFLDDLSS